MTISPFTALDRPDAFDHVTRLRLPSCCRLCPLDRAWRSPPALRAPGPVRCPRRQGAGAPHPALPSPVRWSGGQSLCSVKGTCCLYHRTVSDPDPGEGDGYCISCPFTEPAHRHRRWAANLEEEAAVGGRR